MDIPRGWTDMNSFNFWQRWLLGLGLYLIAFGLALAFFSQSALMDFVFNKHIDPVFWGLTGLSENATRFQSWIYGVLGAVICGWGIYLSFLAHHPFRRKERWAWDCIGAGFIVWFVIDSVLSLHHHVGFNAIVNTVLLLLVALPLLFTRKHFSNSKKGNA
jgi:hypothetical protein